MCDKILRLIPSKEIEPLFIEYPCYLKPEKMWPIYPSKMSYWDKITMLDRWGIKHPFFDVNKKYFKEIKHKIKLIIETDRIMKKFMGESKMIDKIIKQLKPLINGQLIYLSQYGSHLYGLNTENSDLDFRGVYIPNLDDIILKKDKDEINTELEIYLPPEPLQQKEHVLGEIYMQPIVSEKGKQVNANRDNLKKVDVKIFSLQKFIQLCSKADTNALDLLFSWTNKDTESYLYAVSDYINPMAQIVTYKNKLINTDRLESPITYAFKQATKYSINPKVPKELIELEQFLEKRK